VCELPIAMLACARIGAVHNVVFAGFSSESLAQRLQDCKCAATSTCLTIAPCKSSTPAATAASLHFFES
jgi:acyl-coenzyme A synthetase/AMP-(fatty) acid ligase